MPTNDVIVKRANGSRAAHSSVPVQAITLTNGHLAQRMDTNLRHTLPTQYARMEETGRIANFDRAAGKRDDAFQGIYFNDSDVYKWLEAACWAIAGRAGSDTARELRSKVDDLVERIAAAQRDDGYLNTYFSGERADQRWTNLAEKHELYCAGHLIQAAIAHHRVTGEPTLLDVAVRFAEHIDATFGSERLVAADGHPEIEMALVELARETGNDRFRRLARFFINTRGQGSAGGDDYRQDEMPLAKRREIVGHAVRAVYLNAGAADLIADEGDPDLLPALRAMQDDMLVRKSSVTGGIGARHEGEAFGKPYELPNNRAYNESCAAIGAVMWMWRMQLLAAEDDSRYGDIIERLIYNAVLPGVSLDGESYFYVNPLRDDGSHRRQPYYDCACCPPNLARFIAQLPGYMVTTSTRRFPESDARHDLIWIHQFADADMRIPLQDGTLGLRMTTRYPWDGDIVIEVADAEQVGDATLQVRIPDWAVEVVADINGESIPSAETAPGQYLTLRRIWRTGDRLHITIPMEPRRIVAHPLVSSAVGRVALMRGPLVYCVEEVDNPFGDVREVSLGDDVVLQSAQRPELLGDVVTISGHAQLTSSAPAWRGALYRSLESTHHDRTGSSEVQMQAVPYMVWANRSAGPMTVWLRRQVSQTQSVGGWARPREN